MSTQVRGLGSNAAESARRSDPQIATRTRIRASRQAANYPENCIKLLGPVPGEYGRRLHHPNPCQETPRTPFLGCFNGLVATALVGQAGARVLARQLADRERRGAVGCWEAGVGRCLVRERRWREAAGPPLTASPPPDPLSPPPGLLSRPPGPPGPPSQLSPLSPTPPRSRSPPPTPSPATHPPPTARRSTRRTRSPVATCSTAPTWTPPTSTGTRRPSPSRRHRRLHPAQQQRRGGAPGTRRRQGGPRGLTH